MQTVKFGSEPLDMKLMLLYMLRKIRYVIYGILLGALSFAGVYYLANNTFSDAPSYTAKGELYLDYPEEILKENLYINDYTWGSLIHTDKAYEYALENMETSLEREYMEQAVSAGLVSDFRFVTVEATTENPELSVELARAYMSSIMTFGKEVADVKDIVIYTEPETAKPVLKEIRILRVSATGALLGFFAGIIFTAVYFLLDDSILIPEDARRRYGLPVVAMLTKRDRMLLKEGKKFYFGNDLSEEAKKRIDWKKQFMKYSFRREVGDCKRIAVMDIGSRNDTSVCMKALDELKALLAKEEAERIDHGEMNAEDAVYTSYDFILEEVTPLHDDMAVVDRLHEFDGTILLIRAGEQNGQMIQSCVDLLRNEKCRILGAVIYDGDAVLWNQYYFSPFGSDLKKIRNAETENG